MKRTKVFLSHISEEAQLAQTIKTQLERAVPGAELFVSTVDVHLGQAVFPDGVLWASIGREPGNLVR